MKNGEWRQFRWDAALTMTTKPVQELIEATGKVMKDSWQAECEAAYVLSQDKVRLRVWQKLVEGGAKLSNERASTLALAEKIINKTLRFGPDGWVELAEKPEEGKENDLRGETVEGTGNRVVK